MTGNLSRLSRAATALALLMLSAPTLLAQEADKAARPTIRVLGEAVASAKPDQAIINIGVVTQAQTAQLAGAQNAQRADAVIAELRRLVGQSGEIKTVSYSVSPNYRYPQQGGQPTITGYTATNVVEVKTNDLNQLGKLIDVATQSGANNIQSLRFTLKDDAPLRAQALRDAARQARAKAEVIASALGLKVQRVLHIEEGGAVVRPLMEEGFAARRAVDAMSATTPVETGTIEVRAMVTLTVEVSQ